MLHHIYRQICTDVSKKHNVFVFKSPAVFWGQAVQEGSLIAALIDP